MIKVLGRQTSGNVQKVLFMLEEIGVPYAREDYGRQFSNTQTPEYLALNPNGKVPTLVDGDTVIWESNTILRYLAAKHAPQLTGATPAEASEVERWMDWLLASVNTAYVAVFKDAQKPAAERVPDFAAQAKELAAALAIADGHLQGKEWFALGRMTIADIALAPIFKRCLGFPIERPAVSALSTAGWERSPRARLSSRRRARSLPLPPPERGRLRAVGARRETWMTLQAALIGLGTMGPGIAARLARGGIAVRAHDKSPEATARARAQVPLAEGVLDRLGIAPPAAGAGAISFHDDLASAVEGAELVIENVPENMQIKARGLSRARRAAAGRHHRRVRHVRACRSPSCRPSSRTRSGWSACTGRTRRTSFR